MTLHFSLVLAAVVALVSSPAQVSADDLSRAAMREARGEARRWRGALGATQILRADLDGARGSAGDEVLLLFTIEGPLGGNSWVQLLVVVGRGEDGAPRLLATRHIGGKEALDVMRMVRVVDGELELRARRWRRDDPACCPSGRVHTRRCRPLEEGSCAVDARGSSAGAGGDVR